MDLSISRLVLSKRTVKNLLDELGAGLAELKDHTITVVAKLYDNIFEGSDYRGASTDLVKPCQTYQIEGDLQALDGNAFKEVFETSTPLLQATKGHNIVIIGPLPRYVTYNCCGEDGYITNQL